MIVSKTYPTDTSLFYSDTIFHIALLSETLSNHRIKSGDLRFFFLSVVKVTKHFLKDIWLISLIILMDYQKSKYFVPSIHKSKKLVINWDDLVCILIHHYMEGTMDKSTPRINCIIFHYYIPAIQSFCSFAWGI